MVLNVVGSNPIGHPKKSLATLRCEGFYFRLIILGIDFICVLILLFFFAYVVINVYICSLNLMYKNG